MFTVPLPWPDAALLFSPPWSSLPPIVRGLLLAFICIIPLVLLVTLYRFELRLVPRLTALALFGLRLGVFVLVLGLVCLQPIYAHDRKFDLPGRVIIAVDRSSSSDVRDPQRPAADKLRLARVLGLHKGVIGEEWIDRWIEDHEQKRDPRLTIPADGDDPQVRLRLQTQRLEAHNRLIASIDPLTRSDLARMLLSDDGLKLLSRITTRHEVELLGFHRDSWEVKPEQLADLFLAPEKDAESTRAREFTDLRIPLLRAQERAGVKQGPPVLGVVLLTDGQHNFGETPARLARELGSRKVPIYPVAIGDLRSPPDSAIVSIRGPDYSVFKDVEAGIDVRCKIAGLKEQEFIIELFREGKEKKVLASKTIQHDGKDRVYAETFPIKFDEVGTQTIVATVRPTRPQEKETSDENNRLATRVNVADDRARVLLVDGEARWEYHYLATALMRDRLIDLERIVFTQPRLDEQLTDKQIQKLGLPSQKWPNTSPDPLSDFQAIILGDIDPAQLPLAQRQQLERYVSDAAGTLIVVAGKRFMPLGYPETTPTGEVDPLRRLLPVEGLHVLAPRSGFPLSLTTAGREARFTELAVDPQENDTLWAGFPRPWSWAVAGRAKPGATVLANWLAPEDKKEPAQEQAKRHVVVAQHNYGFGRVLYLGIDSTWRWRYKIGDQYHHRFWGQVVRWAAADKPLVVGNAYVRFGTPQPVYRPDEVVEVVVRLSDSLGVLRSDLLAGARILKLPESPGEKEQAIALAPLERRPAQPRVLQGNLRDLPPGRYAVELAIPDLADKLLIPPDKAGAGKPLRASFTVLPPESKEMIDLELNRPLLDDLASASGGKVFTLQDFAELEKLLVTQGIPTVEHHEQRLWQWWGFLVIVVVLLSVEWVARKLAGLP